MPHYVTLSLNNIAVFSFPATANQQPTGSANGNGVDVDASASQDVDNNDAQQPASSPPVQEQQGEEIDQHEETGNSYEHFILKNR